MKKYILFVAFVCFSQYSIAQQNDYIVTWDNDTIYCEIAESPKDVGLKFIRAKEYFYDYIIASFGADSQKIYYPSKIKAYRKISQSKNGSPITMLMQSDSVSMYVRTIFKNQQSKFIWHKFVRSLIKGGHYNLYFFEDYDFDGADRYFVLEDTESKQRTTFVSTKQLRKLLHDWPQANTKSTRYKDWFLGKQYLVLDYNSYKNNNANSKK